MGGVSSSSFEVLLFLSSDFADAEPNFEAEDITQYIPSYSTVSLQKMILKFPIHIKGNLTPFLVYRKNNSAILARTNAFGIQNILVLRKTRLGKNAKRTPEKRNNDFNDPTNQPTNNTANILTRRKWQEKCLAQKIIKFYHKLYETISFFLRKKLQKFLYLKLQMKKTNEPALNDWVAEGGGWIGSSF